MIPDHFLPALARAHPSWQPVLQAGLESMAKADPAYLPGLAQSAYLPTGDRLFAAFALPLEKVRHVLVGEGPYPREESATGVCFMDGAVMEIWSAKGLSTRVNRATSLRNFIKMLLVCEGSLALAQCTGEPLAQMAAKASAAGSGYIQSLPEMQQSLYAHGFLLLNATLVFRPDVAPMKEAKSWRPFLQAVLDALAARDGLPAPTLVLWGKVAEVIAALPGSERFPKVAAEHPYNLSFIGNPAMHAYFRPLALLRRAGSGSDAVK